ncbi:MAG: HDOD domain-containing protein [Deferribacteraceae bacterium]|nr:HDOD domain-containing protein [Deferribacteraceae bacterium]
MLQILFTGTDQTLNKFQTMLKGYASVTHTGKADIHVCEVRNIADLKYVPSKSPIPLFLIISSQDKTLVGHLKPFRISGVFIQPLNEEVIKRKLNITTDVSATPAAANSMDNNFESLKVKILAKAESVNSLPVFAQRLLKLTSDDLSSIKEITTQIKMDQGISGKIIRMANSPFFGMSQDINNIDRAVVLLGFKTVKNISLAASTNAYYNKRFGMYKTTGNALWEHAYLTAVLCEAIASDISNDAGAYFLAGLLHDIGKTIMVDFLVSEVSDCKEEREQLGTDHAEVAGMLLNRWQLPNEIIQMVRLHHNHDDTLQSKIVYFANRLAHSQDSNCATLPSVLSYMFDTLPVKNRAALTDKVTELLSIKKVES